METEVKKHWKTLEKEAKEQGLNSQEEKLSEIEVNNEEVVETEQKEPSVPLSQVSDLVNKMLEEKLANLPIQPSQKVVEVVKEVHVPLVAKDQNFDEIPGLEDFEIKDRMYVLCNNFKPISRGIRNRSKPKAFDLFESFTSKHFIGTLNQTSFEDKQKEMQGSLTDLKMVCLEPLKMIFHCKVLVIHPDNKANGGSIFEEYDPTKEATAEIEKEDKLFEAQTLVRSLSFTKQDAIARIMCSDYKEEWVSAELKRSLYSAVAKNPEKFLKLANQPSLEAKGIAKTAQYRGIISYSNYKWYNEQKEVLVEVSRNEDELDAIAGYLLQKEFLEKLKCHLTISKFINQATYYGFFFHLITITIIYLFSTLDSRLPSTLWGDN